MLYNPKWDRIFTTEAFAEWLAQKPRNETYKFTDPDNCAVTQYFKAHGLGISTAEQINSLGWTKIVCTGELYSTFGDAANRARLIARGGLRLRVAHFFGMYGFS